MALAFSIRSLDAIPGLLREHYARQPDGSYALQIAGEHPAIAALQAQITNLRTVAQQEAHAANVRIAAANADKKALARRDKFNEAKIHLASEINNAGGNAAVVDFVARGVFDDRIAIDDAGAVVLLDRSGQPTPMTMRELAADIKAHAPAVFA